MWSLRDASGEALVHATVKFLQWTDKWHQGKTVIIKYTLLDRPKALQMQIKQKGYVACADQVKRVSPIHS